ncbi:MAG: 50S ribosomal protein L14e [Candidatus Hydrothermarchaeaceae archaeon]|jgi:large subunit ribosomal protein L14e
MDVGRVCIKLVGREAGKTCVIVEKIDKNFVVVDSPDVKRRRCNIRHLDPLEITVDIKKGASGEDVKKTLKKVKIPVGS